VTTEPKLWRCVERLDVYEFERDGDAAEVRILSPTRLYDESSRKDANGLS
jgi:hypothetical protein